LGERLSDTAGQNMNVAVDGIAKLLRMMIEEDD